MTPQENQEIIAGTVVEFFEAKQVLCGVCLASKNQRMNILTEQNKEINLARSRLIHVGSHPLSLQLSRDEQVKRLGTITALRKSLMEQVKVEEIWSLLESEEEAYDAREMAEFVFTDSITENHIAAVQRVLLLDRIYFQFKDGKFVPRTADKVEARNLEIVKEEEREARLDEGSAWLQAAWTRKGKPPLYEHQDSLIEDLKSFCLYGQESPVQVFVKELFRRASIPPQQQSAFRLLVRLGIWHENENLYLHEENITPDFPKEVEDLAGRLATSEDACRWSEGERRDLRHLHAFTIDSSLTRDYDDALSIDTLEDGLFQVGVHIADAAHFVTRDDPLDREAEARASSIYLPDGKISMLPSSLSEDLCSLKADRDRLAISFLMKIDAEGALHGQEIALSVVKIREQLTYEEVNERVRQEPFLRTLHDLAVKLRDRRLAQGAIILPLPEIQVYVNAVGMIQVSRYEKETPSQIMVSEWMIAANALAATYLSEREIPAIFRSQAECKQETDFTQSDHELFHVYRRRRLFARAELDTKPHMHCSLALPAYTTVTSPIRRCSDLIIQRQLKHALATGSPLYTEDELRQLITKMGTVQSKIFYIQRKWTRYWILKYMEQEDYHTINTLVLDQNDRFAHLLIPEFLMETNVLLPENTRLQPGEMIKVKVERLNPREDLLRVQL